MKRLTGVLGLIAVLSSCMQTEHAGVETKKQSYFDLASYMRQQVAAMQKTHPEVLKSVTENGIPESKTKQIVNWKRELAIFAGSDINKPAWRSSYREVKKEGEVSYLSTDPKLRTRQLSISSDSKGRVTHIRIVNHTSNYLYTSNEVLDFFPDSLYQVEKKQQVMLLGETSYLVTGKINTSSQ
ncbi:hypothetical protein [Hufsiella ginkgonis]|uniref:DUF4251 domain-containing protein n=1 Tax=Hufsiella ginkgonis TaxID=2695274 RepID=A0A7K1XXW6_9SPHI|nr:hypothetical protein [Hufsiella ginkgonis]MXV15841.1 hypothetical protein [Hufsiella ginkgonis]